MCASPPFDAPSLHVPSAHHVTPPKVGLSHSTHVPTLTYSFNLQAPKMSFQAFRSPLRHSQVHHITPPFDRGGVWPNVYISGNGYYPILYLQLTVYTTRSASNFLPKFHSYDFLIQIACVYYILLNKCTGIKSMAEQKKWRPRQTAAHSENNWLSDPSVRIKNQKFSTFGNGWSLTTRGVGSSRERLSVSPALMEHIDWSTCTPTEMSKLEDNGIASVIHRS